MKYQLEESLANWAPITESKLKWNNGGSEYFEPSISGIFRLQWNRKRREYLSAHYVQLGNSVEPRRACATAQENSLSSSQEMGVWGEFFVSSAEVKMEFSLKPLIVPPRLVNAYSRRSLPNLTSSYSPCLVCISDAPFLHRAKKKKSPFRYMEKKSLQNVYFHGGQTFYPIFFGPKFLWSIFKFVRSFYCDIFFFEPTVYLVHGNWLKWRK